MRVPVVVRGLGKNLSQPGNRKLVADCQYMNALSLQGSCALQNKGGISDLKGSHNWFFPFLGQFHRELINVLFHSAFSDHPMPSFFIKPESSPEAVEIRNGSKLQLAET